jgi:hypothetical protein
VTLRLDRQAGREGGREAGKRVAVDRSSHEEAGSWRLTRLACSLSMISMNLTLPPSPSHSHDQLHSQETSFTCETVTVRDSGPRSRTLLVHQGGTWGLVIMCTSTPMTTWTRHDTLH